MLHSREAHFIRTLTCVNKCIPTTTKKEWHEDNKERINANDRKKYENNRETILEYKKEWYEKNKEKISEKYKDGKYYEKNKDKIFEWNKVYWEKNKDKIIERRKEKITCECGKIFTICNKTRHEQSNKHQNYLKSIQLVKLLQ